MRVCVFGTRGFPKIEGGVEKHCESLYTAIKEDAKIIVFRRKPYVSSKEEYNNIHFVDLPSTKIKGFEAVLHSFLATVCSIGYRADVVHIHNIGPALFAPILKLFSIPVVLTYHSPNYEHKKWGNFAKKLLRFCEHVALKYSDRIIFVNRAQMQKFPEAIRNKSEYIPNGVYAPEKTSSKHYLEEIGLETNKYVLSVGRITPEKCFHDLIKAYRNLNPEGYKLVIAGSVGSEKKYMKELLELSEGVDVVFTGFVYGEQLSQLYSNAALFVLASENEGFPMVLLEAMSYDRDVLVSDIPAMTQLGLADGDYFPVCDEKALADKMKNKLQNVHSREYDLSEFDWDNIAARYYDTLFNLKEQNRNIK